MISKTFLKFASKLALFILIIAAVAAYPVYKLMPMSLVAALAQSIVFFFCLTLLVFGFIIMRSKKGKEVLNGYFLSIGLKMMIGLIYFVVMLQDFKGLELGFTISFFSSYFLCTSFEVYYLMTNLRQISDTSKDADI